uniref:Uncharacterized protein n=1 Tax=Romanomermis culicivorax TaxID=13658 RepID=A0A915I8A8_ROMCU
MDFGIISYLKASKMTQFKTFGCVVFLEFEHLTKPKAPRYEHDVQLFLLAGTFNNQCKYRFVNNEAKKFCCCKETTHTCTQGMDSVHGAEFDRTGKTSRKREAMNNLKHG